MKNRDRCRILVLDDDTATSKLVERMLEPAGLDVRTCGDGAAGFRLAAALGPDLILSDVHMNGYDPGERLRRLARAAPSARILLMTGGPDGERLLAVTPGAVGLLRKPFTREALLVAVGAALGERFQRPVERRRSSPSTRRDKRR